MRLFDRADFEVFQDQTLTGRLGLIQSRLDPKFAIAAPRLQAALAASGVPDQFAQVAKHLRRHKNPPPNTWLALSPRARGYKMTPHLELGFWNDRMFLWVAMLAESKPRLVDWPRVKAAVAQLPEQFELSVDHTKKAVMPLDAQTLTATTTRFDQVARSEWLIGQTYLRTSPLFDHPDELWADLLERTEMLAPVYQALLTPAKSATAE
ncbi:DUF1054 family protein [Lacticaseibacillus nasuensis]|uniref:Uncharacterized protein n=1 Tax=Lacticaseibacillus nasuensis JCM 17158 TaxID=1291734 RepID=A0A0R1JL10_9LACO|nr:DUF1054 family protein [Lacticaseibacillus nasuensis]KRK71835.1 hypothetical protein FD02_GL002080 [Lacticaseibacillus nasuensis JCM 17158]